jgi:hypothetical protein
VLVNQLRVYLQGHGATGVSLYAPTMYLMAGLLIIGLICNLLVRPVDPHYHFHGQSQSRGSGDDSLASQPRPAHA